MRKQKGGKLPTNIFIEPHLHILHMSEEKNARESSHPNNESSTNSYLPEVPLPTPISNPFTLFKTQHHALMTISQGSKSTHILGRRTCFNNEEDLFIIREVAAAKAHIGPNGNTRERFEIEASKVNSTVLVIES